VWPSGLNRGSGLASGKKRGELRPSRNLLTKRPRATELMRRHQKGGRFRYRA
jgi:hypothetical protein